MWLGAACRTKNGNQGNRREEHTHSDDDEPARDSAPMTSAGRPLTCRTACVADATLSDRGGSDRARPVHCRRLHLGCHPGDGLKILLASLNRSRPSVAAHALGIARGAFEDAVNYINERKQSGRKIVEFQGIQFMLADMATDLAQCEAWLWHVARMVDGGATDFGVESSMLKMRASDIAMRITTDAVQLHGGYGYCKDYRVERLMRDAKITQIWEGTNQIHRQLIGRSFLKK